MNSLVIAIDKPGWIAIAVVTVAILAAIAILALRKKKPAVKQAPESSAQTVEIYVGNLSYEMKDADLRAAFEKFGIVESARIIVHRPTGKSKGYGFVEMPHRREAQIAIKALNDKEVMGRKLRVNEARHGTRPASR